MICASTVCLLTSYYVQLIMSFTPLPYFKMYLSQLIQLIMGVFHIPLHYYECSLYPQYSSAKKKDIHPFSGHDLNPYAPYHSTFMLYKGNFIGFWEQIAISLEKCPQNKQIFLVSSFLIWKRRSMCFCHLSQITVKRAGAEISSALQFVLSGTFAATLKYCCMISWCCKEERIILLQFQLYVI